MLAVVALVITTAAFAACGTSGGSAGESLKVAATTSILRDVAQNVAGGRFTVGQLIPNGVDPHEFDPTPAEVTAAVKSDLLIVNGANLEGTLAATLRNAGVTTSPWWRPPVSLRECPNRGSRRWSMPANPTRTSGWIPSC